MISKNQTKLIRQLEQTKHRRREQLFVAEGPKVVGDLLRSGMEPRLLLATDGGTCPSAGFSIQTVSDDELHRVSFLQHPQQVLALFPIPQQDAVVPPREGELVLALDVALGLAVGGEGRHLVVNRKRSGRVITTLSSSSSITAQARELGLLGDDILGTFSVLGEAAGMRVFLITGDKDAYQLVTDKTSVVTTKKGMSDVVVYTPDKVLERYGVTPAQVPDFLGLKGDPSDNIPGVPGIGEKTAARLLSQYGTLDELIAHADEVKGKMGQNLREHVDDARISRDVATIRKDAPVDLDLDALHFPDFDAKVVADAFGSLHFNRHLREVLALAGADAVAAVAAADHALLAVGKLRVLLRDRKSVV